MEMCGDAICNKVLSLQVILVDINSWLYCQMIWSTSSHRLRCVILSHSSNPTWILQQSPCAKRVRHLSFVAWMHEVVRRVRVHPGLSGWLQFAQHLTMFACENLRSRLTHMFTGRHVSRKRGTTGRKCATHMISCDCAQDSMAQHSGGTFRELFKFSWKPLSVPKPHVERESSTIYFVWEARSCTDDKGSLVHTWFASVRPIGLHQSHIPKDHCTSWRPFKHVEASKVNTNLSSPTAYTMSKYICQRGIVIVKPFSSNWLIYTHDDREPNITVGLFLKYIYSLQLKKVE